MKLIKFPTSPLTFHNQSFLMLGLYDKSGELISFCLDYGKYIFYVPINSRVETNVSKYKLVDIFFDSDVNGYDLKRINKYFQSIGLGLNFGIDGKIISTLNNKSFTENLIINDLKFKELSEIKNDILNWYKSEYKKYQIKKLPKYLKFENHINHILSNIENQKLELGEGEWITPEYNLTYTGRIYTRNPNIQGFTGAEIKRLKYNDFCLLGFDYISLHMGILANLSQDEKLIKILKEKDIHNITSKIFLGYVDRDIGKKINYSLMYNISLTGLSKMINIPDKKLEQKMIKFKKYFSGLWRTLQRIDSGEINTTLLGRKIKAPSGKQRSYLIQAIESEILKIKLNKLYKLTIKNKGFKILVLQHDKMILGVKKPNRQLLKKLVKTLCFRWKNWSLPLMVKEDSQEIPVGLSRGMTQWKNRKNKSLKNWFGII